MNDNFISFSDLALSVTMTAISTILSIFFLPINLLFYTRFSYHNEVVSALDWTSLFIALAVVITAITAGLFASYYNSTLGKRSFQKLANHMGNFAGFSLILFSSFISNSGSDSDSKVWSRNWQFYVGVASPCVGGLLIANLISTVAKLRKPERVTVAIECCYQNVSRLYLREGLFVCDAKEMGPFLTKTVALAQMQKHRLESPHHWH